MNACYSQRGALAQIGVQVETVGAIPDIPIGARGRIVDADEGGIRGWVVRVDWDLPPKRSLMMAETILFPLNIPWTTKRPVAEFTKSEAERLLKWVGE